MASRSNGLAAEMEAVRTLALVGAAAAGKTSLAEAMLHKAGAIGACGSVERGSTVSDHDPLERRMQHSLNASVMHLTHAGTVAAGLSGSVSAQNAAAVLRNTLPLSWLSSRSLRCRRSMTGPLTSARFSRIPRALRMRLSSTSVYKPVVST